MKTVRFFLVAVLFLIGIDRVIYFIGEYFINISPNRFSQLYHGNLNAELLILGNSRADLHFDSVWIKENLKMDAVNLGLGGNHMVLNAILLEDYMERHNPPKVLIVEISSMTVEPTDMGDFLTFVPASGRLRKLARSVMPYYALAGVALQGLWLNNDMFLRITQEMLRPPQVRVGARSLSKQMPPEIRSLILPVGEVYEENIKALEKIGKIAEYHGIRLIPIISPFAMSPENIVGIDDLIYASQAALGQFRIYDYSNFIDDPALFSDPTHLNINGLIWFNNKIFFEDNIQLR